MSDNVIEFSGITKGEVDPQKVLQGALDADLKTVIVLAWHESGDSYFASSTADGGDILWLLENFKKDLLNLEFMQ